MTLALAADPGPVGPVLTPEERAYVEANPVVTMCVDPDWPPFERIDAQGQHTGIAADLVRLVTERVGLRVEVLPLRTWDESLAASKAGRCQTMSFLNQTPARDAWLSFTAPIFRDHNVIITREEHPYVADLADLGAARVALPRGTMVAERILQAYPALVLVPTDSEEASVQLVSSREADLTIRSLMVSAYAIRKEGLFNLKIAGQVPSLTNHLRIGVRKELTMLRDILDKGVSSLSAQEVDAIANRHVAISVQQGVDKVLIWQIVGGACFLLVLAYLWNRKLSMMNRALERLSITDKLTGLANRRKLDEVIESEIQRAQRFDHRLGVIMLDLDHFKQVNDTYGHQVGDKVLAELGELLRSQLRETDVAGRWGGEEFLVICPHTDESGVMTVAEKIWQALQVHSFPGAGRTTASLGVTSFRDGDEARNMIARADMALYSAKRNGRNRVELAQV